MHGDHYDELRRKYASSIWLRSEHTTITYGVPAYTITVHTTDWTEYSVEAVSGVDILHFETGEYLLLFRATWGDTVAKFAIVSPKLVNERADGNLEALLSETATTPPTAWRTHLGGVIGGVIED